MRGSREAELVQHMQLNGGLMIFVGEKCFLPVCMPAHHVSSQHAKCLQATCCQPQAQVPTTAAILLLNPAMSPDEARHCLPQNLLPSLPFSFFLFHVFLPILPNYIHDNACPVPEEEEACFLYSIPGCKNNQTTKPNHPTQPQPQPHKPTVPMPVLILERQREEQKAKMLTMIVATGM